MVTIRHLTRFWTCAQWDFGGNLRQEDQPPLSVRYTRYVAKMIAGKHDYVKPADPYAGYAHSQPGGSFRNSRARPGGPHMFGHTV